jgi:hypothetical protein
MRIQRCSRRHAIDAADAADAIDAINEGKGDP